MSERIFRLVLSIGLVMGISGCARSSSQRREESPLTHAYRLIDAHRDDEAIAYLTDLCGKQPSNDCFSALASAYAHKAGIRVQRFVGVLLTMKSAKNLSLVFDSSPVKGEDSAKVDHSLDSVSTYLNHLTGILSIYSGIPEVSNTDNIYLDEAIRILDSLERPRQQDGLYRAILRVISFKHAFAEELIGPGDQKNLGPACEVDFPLIQNSINDLDRRLLTIVDDLEIGNPSQKNSLDRLKIQVNNDAHGMAEALDAISKTDAAGVIYFKSLLIAQRFGKLLKCKGGDGL